MRCKNCVLRKVCKVTEMIKNFEGDIDITVNSCNYETNRNTISTVTEKPNNKAFLADSFDQEEYNRLLKKMNGETVKDINNIVIECKT